MTDHLTVTNTDFFPLTAQKICCDVIICQDPMSQNDCTTISISCPRNQRHEMETKGPKAKSKNEASNATSGKELLELSILIRVAC